MESRTKTPSLVVGPSVAPAGPEGGPDRPGNPDPASKHVFTRRPKP